MRTRLKNISVCDPVQNINDKYDILIENGVIIGLSAPGSDSSGADREIDFTGCVAVPGFFDMHVHLREPGREDKETVITGCNSAARGGFTGVACMPNTTPAIDSAETVHFIRMKAEKHLVDVHPVAAATLGRKGETLSPIAELSEAGAVAFSDDGVAIKTAAILRRVMEYANMFDKPVIEHCEDDSLAGGAMNEGFNSTIFGLSSVPPIAEELTVARDIMMAEYTGARVHIAHISTKNAIDLVRQGKAKGIKVTAEVTPHHFTLTDDMLAGYDTNYKMNPPLRTAEDVAAAVEGLRDGTIDCIASDHAPHTLEEKEMEFEYAPNGILGLETQVGITLTELYHNNILSLEQIVEKLAINPRKILGLEIPSIKEGAVANITILDPESEWQFDSSKMKSKSFNTPFHGTNYKGCAKAVINKGQIYHNDTFSTI